MEALDEIKKAILSFIEESQEKPEENIMDKIAEFFEEDRKNFFVPEIFKKEEEEEEKKKPPLEEVSYEEGVPESIKDISWPAEKYTSMFSRMYDDFTRGAYENMRNEINEPIYSNRLPILDKTLEVYSK